MAFDMQKSLEANEGESSSRLERAKKMLLKAFKFEATADKFAQRPEERFGHKTPLDFAAESDENLQLLEAEMDDMHYSDDELLTSEDRRAKALEFFHRVFPDDPNLVQLYISKKSERYGNQSPIDFAAESIENFRSLEINFFQFSDTIHPRSMVLVEPELINI